MASRSAYSTNSTYSNVRYRLSNGALGDQEKLDIDLLLHATGQPYVCKAVVGEGAYGRVYRLGLIDVPTRNLALKRLTKSESSAVEMFGWRLLGKNPYIVSIIFSMESPDYDFIGMTYYQRGDLHEYLTAEKPSLIQARRWGFQILSALSHIISIGLSHQDIKPKNLFLTDANTVVLGDFSFLKQSTKFCKEYHGSFAFMPPEIIDVKVYCTVSADMYSVGMCYIAILKPEQEFREMLDRRGLIKPAIDWKTCIPSSTARIIVRKMIADDPKARPTVQELLQNKHFIRSKFEQTPYDEQEEEEE